MNYILKDKGYAIVVDSTQLPILNGTTNTVHLLNPVLGSAKAVPNDLPWITFGTLFTKTGYCMPFVRMNDTNLTQFEFYIFSTNGSSAIPFPQLSGEENFRKWAINNGYIGYCMSETFSIPQTGSQTTFKLPFVYNSNSYYVTISNATPGSSATKILINYNTTGSTTFEKALVRINYLDLEILSDLQTKVSEAVEQVENLTQRMDSLSSVMTSRFVSR